MTEENLSAADQAKLASGDYVVDPVFGVQPKTPEIQRRDYDAAFAAVTTEPTVPASVTKAPVTPKDNPQP